MRLEYLKTIENTDILKELVDKNKLLLVYSAGIGFVLFNTTVISHHGYHGSRTYKGITEKGKIHNMFLSAYSIKVTATPYDYFVYFKEGDLNTHDIKFLDKKKNEIIMLAVKKKNHREILEIKN